MPVSRYKVVLRECCSRNEYAIFVTTTSEHAAVKIAKKKLAIENGYYSNNLICIYVESV